jgi:VanZ family protein
VVIHLRPSAALRVLRPWWFAVAAVGVMAFIAYGSFVPFEYQPREWDEATAAFRAALGRWASPPSRSDFAANVALGIPLGFCLLAALRVDRPNRWLTAGVGVLVAAGCGLYAGVVEFGQLYFPGRVCSGADVFAQAVGGAIGVGAWVLAGPRLTDKLRRAFDTDAVRKTTVPLLCGYAALLLLVQTLPLDLTASPYEIARRLKTAVTWTPLGELFETAASDPDRDWKALAGWCQVFAVYLPAGLLLGGLGGKFRTPDGLFRVVGVGFVSAAALELCQVLVMSRHPSTTDVLLGTLAVTLGWAAARVLTARGVRKRRGEAAVLLAQVWAGLMAGAAWSPYQFYPGLTGERLAGMHWLPLRDATLGPYLWAAEDLLVKFALALPLGGLAAWGLGGTNGIGSRPAGRWAVPLAGVLTAAAVATVLELGQAMLPSRVVCPTDVLLAAAGGWCGAAATRWATGAGATSRPG